MTWTETSRGLIRLGLVALALTIVASVWQLLAMQLPESLLHAGVLPGPVDKLRSWSALAATLALALGLTRAGLGVDLERPKLLKYMYGSGALVGLTLIYGAATGMPGEQLIDPRVDAQVMIALRVLGLAAGFLCLGSLGLELWRASRREANES